MRIATWLRQLGLEAYEPALRDNAIDVEALKTLEATDLEEIGVTSRAHRKLLLNAIVSLRDRRRRARGGTPLAAGKRPKRLDAARVNGAGLLRLPAPIRRPPEMLEQELPTPLVGREEELGLLLRAWRRARNGAGQVVLLSGAPGIGKSRLLRALRERLGGAPHTPLTHHCSPDHVGTAFHPIIGLPPERRRPRIFAAALGQLEDLAARQTVLAIYEDLHWADASTLELLELVVDRIRHLPMLAVMSFRPGFAVPWGDRSHVACLPLAALGPEGARAMVDHLTAGTPLPEPLLEQILPAAEGVPLVLEELTRAVLETGLVAATHAPDEAEGGAPAIPSSLRDALVARLDRRPQAGEAARIAAAIGSEFTFELLQAVADRPEDELRDAVDRLVASGLVLLGNTSPQGAYAFRHAMIRDAIHESTPESLRRSLHARIARTIEERFPDLAEPEVLARHYAGAGLIEGAIDCRLRASAKACEGLAHAEAIGHLCRGLELLDGLPPAPDHRFERLSLLAALGRTLSMERGCASPEVLQAFDLAGTLCREVDETPELFPLVRGLCDHHLTRAEHESAREFAAQCARLAAAAPEPGRLIDAQLCQGVSALFTAELGPAHEHLTRSALLHDAERGRSATRPLARHPRAVPLAHLAQTLWLRGFPDQAVRAGEEAVIAARAAGQPFALAYVLLCVAWLHQLLRQPATTLALAAQAIDCAAEEDLPAFHAMATLLHAWAAPEAADIGRVEAMREALGRYRATGAELARPWLLGLLADVQGRAGDLEAGLSALAEGLEASRGTGERWYEPELCRQEGELLLRRSIANRRTASAGFCQALTLARQQGSRSLELRAAVSLARLWADLHRRGEARAMLEPICGWFSEGVETPDLKDAKALLDELR